MKKFIRYLYEYQNGERVRNTGFIRIEIRDDGAVIDVYGKGFPASVSQRLEIFLFQSVNAKCVRKSLGIIRQMRPMAGYRFEVKEDLFSYHGILIVGKNEIEEKWYAATWTEMEESFPLAFIESEREGDTKVYKINRKDLVELPKYEWKLANNHFLVHGCRNFHHLISFEKDGKCWIGVPGIFHEKEQMAARAFGFEQFMKPDEGEIRLSEEEQSDWDNFGYWCRAVNNVIKGRRE